MNPCKKANAVTLLHRRKRIRKTRASHESFCIDLRIYFGKRAIGAGDGVFAGIIVPRRTKGDCLPLRDRAAELNVGQTGAIPERTTTNARHAVGNDNAR